MIADTPEVTLTAIDFPPEVLVQPQAQDSSTAETAVVMDEMVSYSNNNLKLVIVIGVLSWLIIVVANVYVIVELRLGGQA
jgi:hypothetical protein